MLTEAVPAGYAKVGPSERPVLARKGPCLRLEYAHHVATRPLSGLSWPSPRHPRATSRRGRWPRCTTRRSGGVRRAVTTGPSRKRPPGRWSNPALSLPTEWSRPRISIDFGSWARGPKSPLHQLSRYYRSCHIILMFGTSFRSIVPRGCEGTSIITR